MTSNAILRFQHAKGYAFSTYACSAIANEMRKTLVATNTAKRRANIGTLSLDAPASDDDPRTLGDQLTTRPDDSAAAAARLADLLDTVHPRERQILEALRDGYTYAEIGTRTGISGTRAQQLIARVSRHALAA